ncbi:alpha/beta fold hydrolase [Bifidobacterium sp. ESL0784]|uniref:alpha/beta fold hydrolase n=1 Tax=Bifidobacterium sp. ESL0784 TaxID=2983231 RepID=UPI0023F95800|nr:alpha/beta fold hydrolase [Bifidobacterium sp. ESL0784]MDF7641639.1 alpha/beta fold hydrolase [Bifidobacterium sp. ESL0784]
MAMQPEAYTVVKGEGLPVIIAHGMGVDHRSLMMLDDAFPEGTQRIYMDLPGYGQTSALPGVGGLPELAEWFMNAVNELVGDNKRFALLGNSMGGALVRDTLSREPRRVAGLALIAPVVDPVMSHRHLAEHVVSNANPDLTHHLPQDKVIDFVTMGVNQSFDAWRRYQRYVLPGTKLCDRDANAKLGQHYWLDGDPEQRMGIYSGPTLIVTGKEDQVVGYEDQKALLPHYQNGVYKVIDPAGHNIHIDQPEAVKSLLAEWAKKLLN